MDFKQIRIKAERKALSRIYYNRKQKFEVTAGKLDVMLSGQMIGSAGGSLPADIKGDIVITLVADPVTSSVKNDQDIVDVQYLVYPNPVSRQLYVRENEDLKYNEMILRNIDGIIVSRHEHGVQYIEMSHLTDGVYILSIQRGTNIENHKVIKSTSSF